MSMVIWNNFEITILFHFNTKDIPYMIRGTRLYVCVCVTCSTYRISLDGLHLGNVK